jgi:hypothetical protein
MADALDEAPMLLSLRGGGLGLTSAQEYRVRAEQLRARAPAIRDPAIRSGFMDLADEYEALASYVVEAPNQAFERPSLPSDR